MTNIKGSISTIMSVAEGVSGTLANIEQASMIPNQARGNTNSGDVNFSNGDSFFTLYYTTLKDEYAKIIDDYFTRFRLCNKITRNAELDRKTILELCRNRCK